VAREGFGRHLGSRLDAQAVGAGHRRVTVLAGLGWTFDAMDIGLGTTAVFAMFAAVLLLISLNVLFLGEETRGRTLEDISGTHETTAPAPG
jgi:hypothetical protein